jgi:imidazole glycerol-phosphate synthase subunit HisH
MSPTITIVDYQMGNLRSVQKALEHVGAQAEVTSDPERVAAAERLILPGVGGFGEAIGELRKRGLDEPIVDMVKTGRPFLGICLGLQLLFETGLEGGTFPGLGLLPGTVAKFDGSEFAVGSGLKVPHMGWNQVSIRQHGCPLFSGIAPTSYFYFVHSYFVQPTDDNVTWLDCNYGHAFCAAIWRENIVATQFHPEKSQQVGLKLLENFANWRP